MLVIPPHLALHDDVAVGLDQVLAQVPHLGGEEDEAPLPVRALDELVDQRRGASVVPVAARDVQRQLVVGPGVRLPRPLTTSWDA